MKKIRPASIVKILLIIALFINPAALIANEIILGEDGKPILEGQEITNGIGIIEEISFAGGYVLINDIRYTIDSSTELINRHRPGAAQSIFQPGVRVVWTAQGGLKLTKLDHYPFDATETAANRPDEQSEGATHGQNAPTPTGSSDIILSNDGVYRN